jgi:mannose-6-phosphate isomerase-like protein (cupin superfamily)
MNTKVPSSISDSHDESIASAPVLPRSVLGSCLAITGTRVAGLINPAQTFAEEKKKLRPHGDGKSSRRAIRWSKLNMAKFALALMPLSAMAQEAPTSAVQAATASVEPHLYISATEIAELVSKATAGAQSGTLINGKSPFNGTTLVQSGLFRARLEYHKAGPKSTTVQFRANPNDAELLVVLDGSGTIMFGSSLADATPSINGSFVGKSLVGGSSYKLTKGDVVMLPENSPHAITEVEGKLVMLSLHLPHPAAVPSAAQAR